MHPNIHQFWAWFQENEDQYRHIKNARRAKELLDNQILRFGKLVWGIDKIKPNLYSLTISPNGDKNMLIRTKKIVELAPDIPNWEFRYCKPAEKNWDFKIDMFNTFMIMQSYDASKWKFVLIEEEDYRIRVEIIANNLDTLDWEDRNVAAKMAVTKLLGEELRVEEVHSIAIVHEFDPQDKEWIYPMREFLQRFMDFIE